MRIFTIIIFLSAGCQLSVNDRVSLEGFDFGTTDPSELFFKNVRQSYYELEERREARMNVFRIKAVSDDSVAITPAIIHHWAIDKAYLWLEPAETLSTPLDFRLVLRTEERQVTYDGSSPLNHIECATEIFHTILDDGQIFIEGMEILPKGSGAREQYRIVLNDYYRLVELK